MGVRRPRRQIDTRGRLLVGLGRQTGSVSSVDGRTVRFAHRRPQLLAAATDHVLEHGLADLRLRSIAEALGISHRTLLGHFSTKEQLVAEILAEIRRRDRAMILAESDRPRNESPSAVLMGTWRRLTCDERLGYWRLFFEAYGLAIGDPERFAPFIDGLVDDWLALTGDLLRSAGAQDEGLPAFDDNPAARPGYSRLRRRSRASTPSGRAARSVCRHDQRGGGDGQFCELGLVHAVGLRRPPPLRGQGARAQLRGSGSHFGFGGRQRLPPVG